MSVAMHGFSEQNSMEEIHCFGMLLKLEFVDGIVASVGKVGNGSKHCRKKVFFLGRCWVFPGNSVKY
jgi:hypothetical protein